MITAHGFLFIFSLSLIKNTDATLFARTNCRSVGQHQPKGPTSKTKGKVKIIAERTHHREIGSCLLRAEKANPIVMNAKTAEISAIETAINPRVTHPKTTTGVKYRPTIRAGATAGKAICLR
jgi:hypothetical protein